ncbi:hypothetical protein RclHR1_13990003 [Rhizophagus clarus]|uniref:Uncharacterized protein n=1 Tax=Rhizophagus clarus TaxID=94130 RepID=A0A2Z6QBE9_9GLOM|nr:hypothetical protein RclHR1_13990003 [Rhizophagus clarus]
MSINDIDEDKREFSTSIHSTPIWVLLEARVQTLKKVQSENIVFLDNSNTPHLSDLALQTLVTNNSVKTPFVVRYPISNKNSKVKLMWGNRKRERKILHTSDLYSFAKEKFNNLREEEIYFINDQMEIHDAYNFNIVVSSQTARDDDITFKLKVMIKGRKRYRDWKLKDVFEDILRQPTYGSFADLQELDMKEFVPLDPPFTEEELKDFVTQLNKQLVSFDNEFVSEMKNRSYINAFMYVTCSLLYKRTYKFKSNV